MALTLDFLPLDSPERERIEKLGLPDKV